MSESKPIPYLTWASEDICKAVRKGDEDWGGTSWGMDPVAEKFIIRITKIRSLRRIKSVASLMRLMWKEGVGKGFKDGYEEGWAEGHKHGFERGLRSPQNPRPAMAEPDQPHGYSDHMR